MNGFVIKYNDIYNLLWEYKEKLEGLIEKLETCENSIRFFIESESFQGESANAIKSYLNDVHITMISSFKVTAQNLLDNIVLYKAGYYEIDSSTNFVLPEEAIREFRKKLGTSCTDTEDCAGEIYGAVSGISDISPVSQPDTNGVFKIHEQLDQELLQFISAIETQESNTVKALENSTDLLIGSLQACIGKIGTDWTDINHYESNSFYTDTDVYTLAGLSQIFYEQHQNYQEVYDQIWGQEQALKDAAEARETQGIWKTVGGVALVVTGGLCIAATGGAATPIVVAGWGIGGGTIAFGVSDSIEGAQDIYYGSMGDIDSISINQLKDVIFQGNEDAYYFAENIFAFAASAFIPISQASVAGNLNFRSGTTIVVKEGISMAAGELASAATMNVTGNQTASMLAGMMASGVTAQGLNGIDAKFGISTGKDYFGDLMSPEDAARYNEYWRELGIGSDKTWKEFIRANPEKNIDDYFRLVNEQSPWPDGYNPKPNMLSIGEKMNIAMSPEQSDNRPGGWASFDSYSSENAVRNSLAITSEFKPEIDRVNVYEVIKPLPVNEGTVGPQIDLMVDTYFPGGGSQIQLNVAPPLRMKYLKYIESIKIGE